MTGEFSDGNYMFFGYLMALFFALSQLTLITVFGISGLVNLCVSRPNNWFNRFKLLPKKSILKIELIGTIKLILSISLVFPFLFQFHYTITLILSALSFGLLIWYRTNANIEKSFFNRFLPWVLIVLTILLTGATVYEREDPINLFHNLVSKVFKWRTREIQWQTKYDISAPKIGDSAPDFEVISYDGSHSVRLSDFHGKKPVALLFGSFT